MSEKTEPQIRINGTDYEIPSDVTLGEQREVKRLFGTLWSGIGQRAWEEGDPDAMVGFLYLTMRRARPGEPQGVIVREVESISEHELMEMFVGAQEAAAERPTEPGSGDPETIPDSAGTQVSATPSD